MTRARSESYDLDSTPFYHCISRCVRRAWLCGRDPYTGQDFEHRKDWIEERLFFLAEIFAIQLFAYAVMSNHLHIVVRVDRALALSWTDEEVVERYTRLFKNSKARLDPLPSHARKSLIALWRERLHDLSWMMRTLNEHIARRANKEDNCTGRFWEGRFKSQPLLDETAVLTCMAYVDLNVVRAGEVESLDEAMHTSITRRLKSAPSAPRGLAPFEDQTGKSDIAVPMHFRDYVEVLEWTGRCSRAYGPGARLRGKPPQLLTQHSLDSSTWLDTMQSHGLSKLTALGSTSEIASFATKKGRTWIRGAGLARARTYPR